MSDREPNDIETRMRTAYASLSRSQRDVTEFLLAWHRRSLSLGGTLARLVGVNRSTVVRTAQALGYEASRICRRRSGTLPASARSNVSSTRAS